MERSRKFSQFSIPSLLAIVMFGLVATPRTQAEQIFFDDFPSTTLDSSKWTSTISMPTIDDVGIGEPSLPYSLRLNGDPDGGDAVESKILDLSIYRTVELTYWYEQTGGGESPDASGEDLIVEYWNGSTWVELERQLGTDPDMTSYVQSLVNLPAAALHTGFRIRFRSVGSTGPYDDWFVDDIELTGELLDDLSVAPPEGFSSSGNEGGPFTPSSKDYILSNTGVATIDWTAEVNVPWLDVAPSSGTLLPDQNSVVSVSINTNADGLAVGSYSTAVTFTNVTSGMEQVRAVGLTVNEIPPPPPIPHDPTPADGATLVDIDSLLQWNGGGSAGQPAQSNVTDDNEITIDASDRGWWKSDGVHDAGNKNTYTGQGSSYLYNSFFVFDLTSVLPGSFVNATLRLEIEMYYGPDPSESLTISDVTTPISILTSSGTDVAVYNDLGSGDIYGTFTVVPADVGNILEITLSGQALTDLSAAAGGFFAVGLKVNDINSTGNEGVRFSSGSETRVHQLVLTPGIPVTYDVYFDTVNPPETLIHSGLTVPNCEPVPFPMDYETTYYWQVVASNSGGQTPGPIWSFTTISPPGEIEVTDSIPPVNDLNMPFGEVFVGLSLTGQTTITNTDPFYDLIVTEISFGNRYFEDFNDGLAQDWHEDIDQNWQVITDEYRAQSSTTDWMMSHYEAKQWEDLSVQMTCHRTGSSSNSAAVTLRVSSDFDDGIGSGYVFQITTGGSYSIWKQVNGSWSWLQSWTYSSSITAGTNTLMAIAEGSSLKFFINGTLIWTGSDSALTSGRIGLGGYTSSGDATHYFDNVLVGKPVAPVQTISEEQLWYNQHSYEGGDMQAVPEDWAPPPYPGKNKVGQQPPPKISVLYEEAFRLENLPSLPLVISPLGSAAFDVVFEPNSIKGYQSSVVIKSNDADEPEVTVQLSGTAIPDYLQITPQTDFEFSGHPGGPFLPSNTYYYLTNTGTVNIDWAVNGPYWLNISPVDGIITPGETENVKVAPNALARLMGEGVHPGQLLFTDVTTTVQQTRDILLNIATEPKIWITPYSFDVNVSQGSSEDENLTIGNGGDGLLNFTLRGKQTDFTPTPVSAVSAYNPMVETKKDLAAMTPAEHSFTATNKNTAFAEGRMLVRFAPQADRTLPDLAAKNSILNKAISSRFAAAHVIKEYEIVRGLSLIELPDNVTVNDALVTLNNTAGILYAEPDYQVKALSDGQTIPNDPLFSELWGLNNTGQGGGTADADIDAPEAWDTATDASGIIVAVIDTGVDYTHPDLVANMWVNAAEANGLAGFDDDGNGYIDDIYGYDFYNNDGNPMDDHYHGTHCSGTIGAVGNNGIGVAGVCWNVKIMALKFLSSSGSGSTSDAIEAVQYATLMGANLSSNSWGGGSYSEALKDAIDAAGSANQLFVAAAGNDYGNNNDVSPFYPASYTCENIIAVLATDRNDNMSSFSNYGPTSVDIGAPGSEILSCQPGSNYQYLDGTSMATPHVSGAAALIWSFSPSIPYQEVKDLLIQTADKIPSLAGRCVSEGRLNLYNAIKETNISWLEFAPQSGSTLPGEVNNVSVLFYGDVPVGTYEGQITASTNDPYTPEINIPVTMKVEPHDYFTELFNAGDNDMTNRTLLFIPNGSGNYYNLCTVPASEFPVNPSGGTAVILGDDDYYEVPLQGHTINFYGTSYDTFYIGSNGYITFESGDTHYFEQISEHFALPRISALFDDLNPLVGGMVSYKELADRVAVTFQNVPEFIQTTTNSFQIEMFFCGKIRITFLDIAAVDGLTGLSEGSGVSVYFAESDLSEYGPCDFINGDLDTDGDVDFFDYSVFANRWMNQHCTEPSWCEAADLDQSGEVDCADMRIFADCWLEGF